MLRVSAFLLAILMVLSGCLFAAAQAEADATPLPLPTSGDTIPGFSYTPSVTDAANGIVRIMTIDENGVHRGASAFGVGIPGTAADTFITTYSAITDANGTPVKKVYALMQDVKLTVTAITPYLNVKKEDVEQESISGQDNDRNDMIIKRELRYEGFDPEKHIELSVLGSSSDQNYALLQAPRPVEGRIALAIQTQAAVGMGDAITVVGFPNPIGTYAEVRGELRNNKGWWTEQTATYTIHAAPSYVNGTTGYINQYDSTGKASFLHSATTTESCDGSALVTKDGLVAGVATAQARFEYAATESDSELQSDYTGIYIEDVTSMLERRGISYGAGALSISADIAAEPTAEPTDEPGDEQPVKAPTFWENAIQYIRQNLLVVIVTVVLLVLIILIIIVLTNGRRAASKAPLVAEDVTDEEIAAATAPLEPMQISETTPITEVGLQGENGEMRGRFFRLTDTLRIGRDPRKNDICYSLQVKGVSAVHCEVPLRDGRVYLKDVGSTYGTFINGRHRLSKGQIIELRLGDRIGVGSDRETLTVISRGGV